MGKAIANLDTYITKDFHVFWLLILRKETCEINHCIRCAKCVDVCPMGLEPYLLAPLSEKSNWEKMEKMHVMDCIECGSCQYTCPAARPLLDRIRLGKNKTGAMIRARNTK